jgi:hypothetical protein
VGSSIIKRQHIKSKMQTTLSELYGMDIPTLRKAATKAYKAYRRYWDHADVSRDTWLEDLAKARAANEQVKKERLRGKAPRVKRRNAPLSLNGRRLNSVLFAARNQIGLSSFSRIKYDIGADQHAEILMVLAQDDEGNWQQQTKHEDITKALIKEHKHKYHQTENTPPMKAPIRQQLGYLGIGSEADDILNGRYTPRPGTDDALATLLTHLKKVEGLTEDLLLGVSTADFQQGW